MDSHPEATVNVTRLGRVETIVTPRPDIHVTGEFPIEDSASLRNDLHNWWQWVLRGGVSAIALDSTKRVDTQLSVAARPGDTNITVATGANITVGEIYKLFHGPSYQLVRVIDKVGTVPATLAISSMIDHRFGTTTGASVFRDQNYFFIQIRGSKPPFPIVDVDVTKSRTWPQTRFVLSLDFYETFSGTL